MFYRVERHKNESCDECEPDHWWGFYSAGSIWDSPLSDDDKSDSAMIMDRFPITPLEQRHETSTRHWFTERGWRVVEGFLDIIDRYDWLRLLTAEKLEVVYEDWYQIVAR